jgi:hypothetical protein
MLLGGSTAFANLPSGGDSLAKKLAEIQTRTAQLNGEFLGLNLRARENITSENIADDTLQDLRDLDVVLHDKTLVPVFPFVNIACKQAACRED